MNRERREACKKFLTFGGGAVVGAVVDRLGLESAEKTEENPKPEVWQESIFEDLGAKLLGEQSGDKQVVRGWELPKLVDFPGMVGVVVAIKEKYPGDELDPAYRRVLLLVPERQRGVKVWGGEHDHQLRLGDWELEFDNPSGGKMTGLWEQWYAGGMQVEAKTWLGSEPKVHKIREEKDKQIIQGHPCWRQTANGVTVEEGAMLVLPGSEYDGFQMIPLTEEQMAKGPSKPTFDVIECGALKLVKWGKEPEAILTWPYYPDGWTVEALDTEGGRIKMERGIKLNGTIVEQTIEGQIDPQVAGKIEELKKIFITKDSEDKLDFEPKMTEVSTGKGGGIGGSLVLYLEPDREGKRTRWGGEWQKVKYWLEVVFNCDKDFPLVVKMESIPLTGRIETKVIKSVDEEKMNG